MAEPDSNTAKNSRGTGKPFQKGDPRINRKGRPKTFEALRKLAQSISHEVAKDRDGKPVIIPDEAGKNDEGETVVIKGHIPTVAEMVMRQWAQSKNPRLQEAFMGYAFGKPPDTVKTELGGDVTVRVIYGDDGDNA